MQIALTPIVKRFNWRVRNLFAIDLRSLAAYRIALATTLLYDYLTRFVDLTFHYTDQGFFPHPIWNLWRVERQLHSSWSLLSISDHPVFVTLIFLAGILFAVFLLVGYRTRFSTVLSWIILFSIQTRNPLINYAGDRWLLSNLLWSMFLPLGAKISWDAKQKWQFFQTQHEVSSIASAGLLLQLVMVYLSTGIQKTGIDWGFTGDAVYYAIQNSFFARRLGLFLAAYPELLRSLTFITLVLERYASLFFLWPFFIAKTRYVLIVSFLLFQVAISLTMRIGLFQVIAVVSMIPFVPGSFWNLGVIKRIPFLKEHSFGEKKQKALNQGKKQSVFMAVIPAMLVLFSFLSFMGDWPQAPLRKNKFFKSLETMTGIKQRWGMFAPNPPRYHRWYVFQGRLTDGTEVDLLRHGKTLSWEKPEHILSDYKNIREQRLFKKLKTNDIIYNSFSRIVCKKWNLEHTGLKRLKSFDLFYLTQRMMKDGSAGRMKKHKKHSYFCPETD